MRPSALRRAAVWVVGLVACSGAPPAPAPPPPPARTDATTVVKLDGGGPGGRDDHDGDGIGDAYDLCAGALEDGLGAHPWDGCPDAADPARRATAWGVSPMLRVTRGAIRITQEIRFGSSSATIDPASQELLRSIAQALLDVPEIELVEVAGHADDQGSPENNRKLTEARARSVLADLAGKRVARTRLRAAGYSSFCPLASGTDDAARAKNRRVEFRILRRDGKNLDPPWGGCDEAEKHGMKPAPLPPPTKPRSPGDDRKATLECSDAGAKACQKRCDAGEVDACEALANAFAADEPKRAFDAASRACTLGALHFCTRAAADLRGGRGVAKDEKRAHALVVGACERGNARACAQAGADCAAGAGEPKDAAKAFALYLRACDAGDAGGCELAAAATWSGDGAPKDRRKSLDLTVAACELGSAKACAAIATASAEEPGLAKRVRGRALAALHVACEQDDAKEACEALAALEPQPGEWQPAPICAAGDFKACQKACDAAYASEPCLELGLAMLYGTGVRRRSADALALFAEACREGSAKGCATAAIVRAGHDRDAKSERAAAAELDAACALGEPSGCVNHALRELEGLGTYRDEESAAIALGAACDKGEAIACAHASRLAARGLGGAKDAARAAALLDRACRGGFRPACPPPPAD